MDQNNDSQTWFDAEGGEQTPEAQIEDDGQDVEDIYLTTQDRSVETEDLEDEIDCEDKPYRGVEVADPDAMYKQSHIVSEDYENPHEADWSGVARAQQDQLSIVERVQRSLESCFGQGSPSVKSLQSPKSFSFLRGRLVQALNGELTSGTCSTYQILATNLGSGQGFAAFAIQGCETFGTYEKFACCVQLCYSQADQVTACDFFLSSGSSSAFNRWAKALLEIQQVSVLIQPQTMPERNTYAGQGMRALPLDDDEDDEDEEEEISQDVSNFCQMLQDEHNETKFFALQSLIKMVKSSPICVKILLNNDEFVQQISANAQLEAELCRLGMALLGAIAQEIRTQSLPVSNEQNARDYQKIAQQHMQSCAGSDNMEARLAQAFAQKANEAWTAVLA
jgi:hypothetical protein